jgi:hypothetical protein
MKSLLLLSSLLSFALATDYVAPARKVVPFNPREPIYLGDVFWPPTMTFIAWLPTEQNTPTEWCWKATDCSDHRLFSLGGVDALQIHDYFDSAAYLTREGKRWADCRITPETGRMGACEGVKDWDCEGGHKFTGPGTRRWSCWVNDLETELRRYEEKIGNKTQEVKSGEITDAMFTSTEVVTGAMASSSIVGAFTPGVTGN